jgi:succinyl-diaminopimelate desuccinylase
VRVVPGLDGDEVIARVRELLGEEVRLERRLDLPPVATDASDPWVIDVFDVMEPLIGERPEPRGLAYFTDASALTPAYGTPPTVICGPGDAAQAHQTDESCSVELLDAAADAFFEIARRWCRL